MIRPAEMVPVFRLSWPDPIAHRYTLKRVRKRHPQSGSSETVTSRLVDCGRAVIDNVYRPGPMMPVSWRTEIATWMQARHALAMSAHLCRNCWQDEDCYCLRCISARRLTY